jgi:hypothetical protein
MKKEIDGFLSLFKNDKKQGRVLESGELGDVVAIRDRYNTFDLSTNVPRVFKTSDRHAWGYSGAGPHDFALDILYHFTRGDEVFARYHCSQLVKEVVSKMPEPGQITPAKEILAWIEQKIRETDPAVYSTYSPVWACARSFVGLFEIEPSSSQQIFG